MVLQPAGLCGLFQLEYQLWLIPLTLKLRLLKAARLFYLFLLFLFIINFPGAGEFVIGINVVSSSNGTIATKTLRNFNGTQKMVPIFIFFMEQAFC